MVHQKNAEVNAYVEQKLMKRLTIMAEFNHDRNEQSIHILLARGKNLFGPDEKDQ